MSQPRIIIVGAGFGGLAAAKALKNTPAEILLIDRTNHHLFQPLLYQVATSVLTPGQIATPIRGVLRNQKNTTVIMGEVTGVDKDQKCVIVSDADRQNVPIAYDYLILATGASHSYFGHNEFAEYAPGLKSLADAEAARNKILQAFETAEAEEDTTRHRDLLTFILVGAGPTGVEMAGDTASLDQNGKPLPGVAQVAIQQGRYAGKLIRSRVVGNPPPGPFSYFDKGTLAVVGKGFAVLQSGKVQISGFGAWLTWAAVHLYFLGTAGLRLSVFLQWVWTYVTGQRGNRLIVNHHGAELAKPAADAAIKPAFAGR